MDATRHNTNHNLGARTTRKTATLSRAERCGQVRVRVSKQVTLIEHASPLVCIVCGSRPNANASSPNYGRAPHRSRGRHGAAGARARGAERGERGPGTGWSASGVRRDMAWYVATVAVRRRGRHMGVGRPSRSPPARARPPRGRTAARRAAPRALTALSGSL
jgi:hypothetical protein